MNKMREAWRIFCRKNNTNPISTSLPIEEEIFKAGYQAAIADVKAGGVQAWKADFSNGRTFVTTTNEGLDDEWYPLYKLPEDK